MANQIIMMNAPFRSYETKQTIARVYRKGQDERCYIWLLDLDTGNEENITSRSIDIMEWSKEQVDVLLGGGKLPKEIDGNSLAVRGAWAENIKGFEAYGDSLFIPHQHFEHVVNFRKATANDLF